MVWKETRSLFISKKDWTSSLCQHGDHLNGRIEDRSTETQVEILMSQLNLLNMYIS